MLISGLGLEFQSFDLPRIPGDADLVKGEAVFEFAQNLFSDHGGVECSFGCFGVAPKRGLHAAWGCDQNFAKVRIERKRFGKHGNPSFDSAVDRLCEPGRELRGGGNDHQLGQCALLFDDLPDDHCWRKNADVDHGHHIISLKATESAFLIVAGGQYQNINRG